MIQNDSYPFDCSLSQTLCHSRPCFSAADLSPSLDTRALASVPALQFLSMTLAGRQAHAAGIGLAAGVGPGSGQLATAAPSSPAFRSSLRSPIWNRRARELILLRS